MRALNEILKAFERKVLRPFFHKLRGTDYAKFRVRLVEVEARLKVLEDLVREDLGLRYLELEQRSRGELPPSTPTPKAER